MGEEGGRASAQHEARRRVASQCLGVLSPCHPWSHLIKKSRSILYRTPRAYRVSVGEKAWREKLRSQDEGGGRRGGSKHVLLAGKVRRRRTVRAEITISSCEPVNRQKVVISTDIDDELGAGPPFCARFTVGVRTAINSQELT